MDALGGYREEVGGSRILGSLLFVAVLVLIALLERLQFRLKATERSTWWASNGRDVLNACALGLMAAGLKIIGFTGPISLAVAATFVIAMSLVQGSLAKWPQASTVLAALGLGVPVVLAPAQVARIFQATIERLFTNW